MTGDFANSVPLQQAAAPPPIVSWWDDELQRRLARPG